VVRAQQQVAELRDRAEQARAAHHARELREQVRRSALLIASKERQLQATTGLFTGKQRKNITAELDTHSEPSMPSGRPNTRPRLPSSGPDSRCRSMICPRSTEGSPPR
jgi:hypothetical protein